METAADYSIYVLRCIYTILPGIMANAMPVVVRSVKFLDYPIDMGFKLNNGPLLGPNKTYRGLFFGVLSSVLISFLQFLVYKETDLKNLTVYDFKEVNFLALGFFMGLGVLIGDLGKSFLKRRLKIAPGKSFIPWDQIDCVLGGLLVGRIAWNYPLDFALIIIIATFIIHIVIRHIVYYMGFAKTKW